MPVQEPATGLWQLHLDPAVVAAAPLSEPIDQLAACEIKEAAFSDATQQLQARVALVNGLPSDTFRPYSREKGQAIMFARATTSRCLQDAGARWDNAFLGFEAPDRELRVDGLRLGRATFVNGLVSRFSATAAELPAAEEFRNFRLGGTSNMFRIDGAIVPTSDWLQKIKQTLFVSPGGPTMFLRACAAPSVTLCNELDEYRLEPVVSDIPGTQRFIVKRKAPPPKGG
jgi:hypothetical protein